MARSSRESSRNLAAVATEQGGYFTAKQAKEAGYNYPHLEYHLAAGNFERVEHGLYRLPTVPHASHDEFIRLNFWSRNQNGSPQAVVSHESALVLHDLTELMPNRIHLTVPPKFRKPVPRGCMLHKSALGQDEVEEHVGFKVTTALRTLVDVAAEGVSQEQLEKAVAEALSRGLVRRGKLIETIRERPNLERLKAAMGHRRTSRG